MGAAMWLTRSLCSVAASIAFGACLPVTFANASVYCETAGTADGFVALRAGPSAGSEMLEKMVPGDEIRLGIGQKGRWIEVTFWRGGRFQSEDQKEEGPSTATGWMHRSLVAPDSCG